VPLSQDKRKRDRIIRGGETKVKKKGEPTNTRGRPGHSGGGIWSDSEFMLVRAREGKGMARVVGWVHHPAPYSVEFAAGEKKKKQPTETK